MKTKKTTDHTPPWDQGAALKSFKQALKKGRLDEAHDHALMAMDPAEIDMGLYDQLLTKAILMGNITMSLIASRFTYFGHITQMDIRICLSRAVGKGDWKSALTCKQRLCEKFTRAELTHIAGVFSKKPKKSSPLVAMIITYAIRKDLPTLIEESANIVMKNMCEIIKKKSSGLTLEEQFLLQVDL